MVNSVLDGITVALYDVFGDGYHYYIENIEQNLQRPCFTVDVLNPQRRSRNAVIYDRTVPCVIHCFTENKITTKHELYATGEEVMSAIEYITVSQRLLRAENVSFQLTGDVLQVFATYKFWTENTEDEVDNMESILQYYRSANYNQNN